MPEVMKKNLIMHVWPKAGSGWRSTVRNVAKRLHVFDGRRVVAVAEGHDSDHTEDVLAELGHAVEIIRVSNDPALREVASFEQLMSSVADLPGHTLYCHGKGSSHAQDSICQEWGAVMTEVCLDHMQLVECMLQRYVITGPFKRFMRFNLNPNNWHYSGTFFWFDNEAVFRQGRDWRGIDRMWFGVESWPGRLIEDTAKAGCLFLDYAGDLYSHGYWDTVVRPALKSWRRHPVADMNQIDPTMCDFVRVRPGYSRCVKCKRVVHDVRLQRRYVCGAKYTMGKFSCPDGEDSITHVGDVEVVSCRHHGACASSPVAGVNVCDKLHCTQAAVVV